MGAANPEKREVERMNLKELVKLLPAYETYLTLLSKSDPDLCDSGFARAFQTYTKKDRLKREVVSYKVDRKLDSGRVFVTIVVE